MKFITCHSETWKLARDSSGTALLAEVDLSSYRLSERPVVTARLYGRKKEEYSLGTCIQTEQGFEVSLTCPETTRPKDYLGAIRPLTPALVQELGLSVYWIVIGS